MVFLQTSLEIGRYCEVKVLEPQGTYQFEDFLRKS